MLLIFLLLFICDFGFSRRQNSNDMVKCEYGQGLCSDMVTCVPLQFQTSDSNSTEDQNQNRRSILEDDKKDDKGGDDDGKEEMEMIMAMNLTSCGCTLQNLFSEMQKAFNCSDEDRDRGKCIINYCPCKNETTLSLFKNHFITAIMDMPCDCSELANVTYVVNVVATMFFNISNCSCLHDRHDDHHDDHRSPHRNYEEMLRSMNLTSCDCTITSAVGQMYKVFNDSIRNEEKVIKYCPCESEGRMNQFNLEMTNMILSDGVPCSCKEESEVRSIMGAISSMAFNMSNCDCNRGGNSGGDGGPSPEDYLRMIRAMNLTSCDCVLTTVYAEIMFIMGSSNQSSIDYCPCESENMLARFNNDIADKVMDNFVIPCECKTKADSLMVMNVVSTSIFNMSNCGCNKHSGSQQPQCTCHYGTYYCNHYKRCIPWDEECENDGSTYCYQNQFQCTITWQEHVAGEVKFHTYDYCAQNQQECDCWADGYAHTCYKHNTTFCARTREECDKRDFNVVCEDPLVKCNDGSCQPTHKDCECGVNNKTWCELFQRCIHGSEHCQNPCQPPGPSLFCEDYRKCVHDYKDCECKKHHDDPDMIYCQINHKCESGYENCREEFDFCSTIGLMKCNNQSLSYYEYDGRNDDDFSRDDVKNDTLFIAVMGKIEKDGVVNCDCLEDEFLDAIENVVKGGKLKFCFCENVTTVMMFFDRIKEEILSSATCSCKDSRINVFFTYLEAVKVNMTEDCDCLDDNKDKDENRDGNRDDESSNDDNNQHDSFNRDDMQNKKFDGRHPPVICGPSMHQCDKCTKQGLLPCPDGSCTDNQENCFKVHIKCGDYGMEQCPEGSLQICADTEDECDDIPATSCMVDYPGWVECSTAKDTCFPSYNDCPMDLCRSRNMQMCPGSDPKFPECVNDLRQCNVTCDVMPKTFLCYNGDCVRYDFECGMNPCPDSLPKRCADRSCIDPDVTGCCNEEQFRCMINDKCINHYESYLCAPENNCASDEFSCPQSGRCVKIPSMCFLPECDESNQQIQCNDGSCRFMYENETSCFCQGRVGEKYCPNIGTCMVATRWEDCFDCPPGFHKCTTNSRKCVELHDDCDDAMDCPPGEGLCHDPKRCVGDKSKCNMNQCPFVCPKSTKCVEDLQYCCDRGTALCHVGDKKGQCVSDSEYFTLCVDENNLCTPDKPVMCSDNECVVSFKDCKCPDDLFQCDDGDCVAEESHCVMNKNEYVCEGMFLCGDGTCKEYESECASMYECPKGFKRCPNGVDCIPYQDDPDQFCPKPTECPAARPIFCKTNKDCVDHINKCPSLVMCASDETLCMDMSCVKGGIENCPIMKVCQSGYVRCNIGGECKQNFDLCPRGVNCRFDEILCPGNICVYKDDPCPEMRSCDKYICPVSNLCVEDESQCPSIRECPAPLIKCQNGECQKSPEYCQKAVGCGDGLSECFGFPDMCVEDPDTECPSVTVCPSNLPFMCWDNTCVENKDYCREYKECPKSMKMCPNGDCIMEQNDCHRGMVCPPEHPIKCMTGECVAHKEKCQYFECPDEWIRCETGECVEDKYFCPSTTFCDRVLCWDHSCRDTLDECPPKFEQVCFEPYPFMCGDGNCYKSGLDCPTGINCPPERPALCHGMCFEDQSKCEEIGEFETICVEGEFLCPDKITCSDGQKCPTLISCTNEFPFRCMDGTCRKGPHACPEVEECNWEFEKKCWDGSCIRKYHDCPETVTCPSETPVLCPNFMCVESKANCTNEFKCPNNTVFCSRNKMCLESAAKCDELVPDVCPEGFTKCSSGMCINEKNDEACFDIDTGCLEGWIRCHKDGSCQPDQDTCDDDIDEIFCPDGLSKCDDGMCRPDDHCNNFLPNGCPKNSGNTKFCSSINQCVNDNDPCPSNAFCPNGLLRCKGGLCIDANEICPVMPDELQKSCLRSKHGNFPCWNSMCVHNQEECPLIFPCPDDAPFRCGDGRCIDNETYCEGVKSLCPPDMSFRCKNGMCATSSDFCPTDNGCPERYPISCDDGKCVDNEEYCETDDDSLANGCSRSASHRCDNGACVVSADKCINEYGCSENVPIRCPNGICVAVVGDCAESNVCPPDTHFACPNGECVQSKDKCKAKSGCPMFEPFRCADGQCVRLLSECPPKIRCSNPSYPHLCASGKCESSKRLCQKVNSCPGGEIRCIDGSCRKSQDCRSICPTSSPFKCPGGDCVSNPVYCVNSEKRKCKKLDKFWCEITSSCVDKPSECFDSISCDTGEFRCFDGACVVDMKDCPEMPRCPMNKPVRCEDGSCQENYLSCDAVTKCAAGKKRCKDGRCIPTIKECPKVGGCDLGEFQCPTFECVDDEDDCKIEGSDKFSCWDGEEYDSPGDCPIPPKIEDVDLTLSSNEIELTLVDEKSNKKLVDVVIPPFSVSSDENSTLAQEEQFTKIKIISTPDDIVAKAVQKGGNGTETEKERITINLCSLVISIIAVNVDGTERDYVILNQPTQLSFRPTCLKGENATLYLGTINEDDGGIDIESNTTIIYEGNDTKYRGEVSHYSSFSLTKFVTQPPTKKDESSLDVILGFLYAELPIWVYIVIGVGACCGCTCFTIFIGCCFTCIGVKVGKRKGIRQAGGRQGSFNIARVTPQQIIVQKPV